LAWVNVLKDESLESRDSEGCGELCKGDLYVGHFGDNLYVKQTNTLRIGFQIVGGFTAQCGKMKDDSIRQSISTWDFDIFGTVETN